MRAARSIVTAIILMLALSACDMTLRFVTRLEADGSGAFSVGVLLDAEAVEQIDLLAEGFDTDGLASLEALFDGLEGAGWVVERTRPDAGLALEATTTFVDVADFDRVLDELRGAREFDQQDFTAGAFTLDLNAERSFLRTRTSFEGTIDTSLPNPTAKQRALIEYVRGLLTIEVRAELPGAAQEVDDAATVGDGVVVWRPEYGSALTFSATTSSLRLGSLLSILIPALALLGAFGWFLLGRRRHPATFEPSAIRWEDLIASAEATDEADELERLLRAEPPTNGHQRPRITGDAPTEPEPPL